jgi:CheY-like chemotaxis protein
MDGARIGKGQGEAAWCMTCESSRPTGVLAQSALTPNPNLRRYSKLRIELSSGWASTGENLSVGYFMRPILETTEATKTLTGPGVGVPEGYRILIICDDSNAGQLESVFRESGVAAETATSMTEGCEYARSGRFQAILSTPSLGDGSWRRLFDVANQYDLGFEVVLLTRNFDLTEWAEALDAGAFDVLDTSGELPRAAEVAKGALWAACLKGAGPRLEGANPRKAA